MDEEDRQIGLRIFLLDNSGSTSTCDGHFFKAQPNGTLVSWPCTRWEEIKCMAMDQAEWNVTIGTPCEFILLNPGPGQPQEGRDFVRIARGSPGEQQAAVSRLRKMLDNTQPNGPTPIADRLNELHQRIRGEHMELVNRGQRVVLVIATDGLPTSARSGFSSQVDKRGMVQELTRLMTDLSVFVVIRLTTDDDSVISFYNEVDEQLELPLEVLETSRMRPKRSAAREMDG